jgi:hypothetical protein
MAQVNAHTIIKQVVVKIIKLNWLDMLQSKNG